MWDCLGQSGWRRNDKDDAVTFSLAVTTILYLSLSLSLSVCLSPRGSDVANTHVPMFPPLPTTQKLKLKLSKRSDSSREWSLL